MTASDIKNIQDMLKANANTYFDTELSIKLAKLKLNIDEQTKIYNEVVTRLLNECAEKEEGKYKTDDNGNVLIKSDKIEMWEEEFGKIENTDFTLDITLTTDDISKLKMTPMQASSLLLIEEDPED